MKPLVSILIPAYNAEPWIADTIQSALRQTWAHKEIVIVDDGSRDATLSIARQFVSKNVSVITQENQGAAGARNTALQLYQGDYVQWLDADDLIAPDKIAQQVEALNRHESKQTLFSSAWAYFMYRPTKAKFIPTPLWCDLSPTEWLVRKMGLGLHMPDSTWLVSRELTQAAGPWDVGLARDNDGEYFCRVILASNSIRFISDGRSYYRRAGSTSVSYIGRSRKKQDSLLRSMRLHMEYLRSLEDSPRTRDACLKYLQIWLRSFYPERPDIVEQLKDDASNLGGQLHLPSLSWKYAWIQKIFGWRVAKEAQLVLREGKENLLRSWDKALFLLGNGKRFAGIRECSSGTRTGLAPTSKELNDH
jgi:glycosyltransferase involved in cell wall biosynthesis